MLVPLTKLLRCSSHIFGFLIIFLVLSLRQASSQEQPVPMANPSAVPASRTDLAWWMERHATMLKAVRDMPDAQLLMIGDSITQNYEKADAPDQNFQPIWQQFYAPRKALNLGFSGDVTSNVLWRLEHGEVDGLHPKVAVLLIGTNNTSRGNQTAEQTEGGVDAVVSDLEKLLPQTHVLLLGILPSGISDSKSQRDAAVDVYLAHRYGEDARVTYLDIASIFYRNGRLDAALYYDPRLSQPGKPLHPDTHGQRMMAEAIEPTLAKLMGDQPAVPLGSMTDINTGLIPVDRLELDSYDWFARHHDELALQTTMKPRVVMLGDSITHFWSGLPASSEANGPLAWQQLFGSMPVINMGFGWDRTQNVLWRLQHGEFEGLAPQWVVLNIGTNNLTGTDNARANTPAEVVDSVSAICRVVHQRSPQSRIIVMAIFPRGEHPGDALRAPIQQTNQLLRARFAKDPQVTYLDIGAQFLLPDGTLPLAMMPDGTHPSEAGYAIWAKALVKAGVKP